MDIPPDVLEVLKCSSCELYLSRGPVYLQHDGAAACGRCYTPKRPATRNTQYEATARLLKFPCKYQEFGCRVTVPYVGQGEVVVHEEVCKNRQYVCPVLGSARCDWLGTRADMLAHCRDQHPDSVLENPCSLTHDIIKPSLHNYIISAFHLLFLLHMKVCVASGKLFHAVRLLGAAAEAAEYFFHLNINRGEEQVTKKGQVAPQGCLAIQEDTSLAVNTNSLLDVLGGFDGATFTVTVKRRVSDAAEQLESVMKRKMSDAEDQLERAVRRRKGDAADQPARVVVKCAVCAGEVTALLYRGKDDWLCERCAPARRACKNQRHGCTHTDINDKCNKHEFYFCQQRTKCYICKARVPRGSLSAHYASMHQDITHRSGSTWRAIRGGGGWQRCLVSSVAGTAVCWYWLDGSQFELNVHTPLSSERLSEFRCEVRVTDPATGHTRIFTPDALYDGHFDWLIMINKEDFPSWSTEFDVCVEIMNAETS